MKNPLVSIIVPNYNCAAFLEERMKSIVEQTYTNYEIILLDDCSLDGSREMVRGWASHPKVTRVLMNDINSGSPFLQWQRGFHLAKGELVWIAEADDSCHPTLLETLVKAFEREEGLSYAFCRCKFVDEHLQETEHHAWRLQGVDGMEGKKFVRKHLYKRNSVFNASCVLFRRQFAMLCDDDFTNYRGCGDWLFWIEMAFHGKVTAIPQSLNYFRRHSTCTTGKMEKSGKGAVEAYSVFQYCCNHNLLSLWKKADVLMRMIRYVWLNKDQVMSKKTKCEVLSTWMQGSTRRKLFCRCYLWIYPIYAKTLRACFKAAFHR